MEKKMTKIQMFEAIKEVEAIKAVEEYVAFIDHEIELLKKKSSNRTATKTQKANVELKEVIMSVLDTEKGYTVGEIQTKDSRLAFPDISPQKVSSLLTQLKNEGRIVREQKGKNKPTYKKAVEEVVEGA
jgi:hypothetical protein